MHDTYYIRHKLWQVRPTYLKHTVQIIECLWLLDTLMGHTVQIGLLAKCRAARRANGPRRKSRVFRVFPVSFPGGSSRPLSAGHTMADAKQKIIPNRWASYVGHCAHCSTFHVPPFSASIVLMRRDGIVSEAAIWSV